MDCKRCGKPIPRRHHKGRPPTCCGPQCWSKPGEAGTMRRRYDRYWELRAAGVPSATANSLCSNRLATEVELERRKANRGQGAA